MRNLKRQKKKPKDFDDLVSRVGSRRSVLDEKFARSVQQTRHASEILDNILPATLPPCEGYDLIATVAEEIKEPEKK